MAQATCTVPGCGNKKRRKLYCDTHYNRWLRNGDPGSAELLIMRTDGTCSVDECDSPIRSRGLCDLHYGRKTHTGTVELHAPEDKGCAVSGCDGKHRSRGFCKTHYRRWMKSGSTELPSKKRPRGKCAVENCEETDATSGYCNSHYRRLRIYGDPTYRPPRRQVSVEDIARVFQQMFTTEDHPLGCWEWTASRNSDGYGVFGRRFASIERQIRAHRLSYVLYKGPVRGKDTICHTCDNKSCVNPNHLYAGLPIDNSHDRWKRSHLPLPRTNPEPLVAGHEIRATESELRLLWVGE